MSPPLPQWFRGFPCLPSLVSLSTCLPAWLWTASGVSRCLSSLEWLHLYSAMASGLSILGGVVWVSGCLSLRVFLHVSPILASGVRRPDVFSLLSLGCHHFSLPFVSRFICLPTHVSSKTTNMHADAAMDMEKLFGVSGGVIFSNFSSFWREFVLTGVDGLFRWPKDTICHRPGPSWKPRLRLPHQVDQRSCHSVRHWSFGMDGSPLSLHYRKMPRRNMRMKSRLDGNILFWREPSARTARF